MPAPADASDRGLPQDNRSLFVKLVVVAALMFAFGWAMVPLYRKICEVTGVNFLTNRDEDVDKRARNTQIDPTRNVIVEFDANSRGSWRFKPLTSHLVVHPGELVHVEYDLVNTESRAMVGQAIPSYAPQLAARHFQKLECFCFTQQTLAAGETRRFPVVFFVDPELPKEVTQITLSYTFFEIPGALPASPAAAAEAPRRDGRWKAS
jgi:cytochrome c oxidase assembly protein subunit 11